jgi:hypothetical protein
MRRGVHAHPQRRLRAVDQHVDVAARQAELHGHVLARALVQQAQHDHRALADEYPEVRVGKLDVEECPDVANRLGVRGVPTVLLFANGAEVKRQLGAVDAKKLRALAGV